MSQELAEWSRLILAGAAVVGVIGAVGRLVWGISRWKNSVDEHRKRVDEDRGTLSKFMAEIRTEIKRILERLPPPRTIAGGSPLKLTEFGIAIAKAVHAHEWAVNEAPALIPEVEDLEPFQIDQFSRSHVKEDAFDKMNVTWQNRVDACAYEFGIDRDGVLDVLYVVLRDELFHRLDHPVDPPA